MNTSFWAPYISDGTIKAICWTLIHSLWIGMVIALVAGLVITFTRKSGAGLRYRLLCGILVLFVVSVSATYYLEARSASVAPSTINRSQAVISGRAKTPALSVYHVSPHTNLFNGAVSFLDQNIRLIFLIWLLFFVLKSLKLVSGLLYIQRIRNYKVYDLAEEFNDKIAAFSSQIGIRRTVRLVQSELVKVPVAVGWVKPVILLPIGIIFQLSTEQLDCILWHELAHIRRRDYLVNVLQGLLETVFFFNPGLLWLSSLIRAEREACCDDMVLSRMHRKANYMEALLAFGYGEYKPTGLAMGIGSGNQLRDRLRRMVNQENKRLSVAEKAVLGIGLILLSAFTTIPKAGAAAGAFAGTVSKTISAMIKTPVKAKAPVTEKNTAIKPGPIVEKRFVATADTVIHFTSVLFKNSDADLANNDISAMDDKGNKYHFILVNNNITDMEVNGAKVADDQLAGFEYMIRYIDREIASKRHITEGDIVAYKVRSPAAKFKAKDSLFYNKRKFIADAKRATSGQAEYDIEAKQEARYNKQATGFKRKQRDDENFGAQQARVDAVIGDLVKAKVVTDGAAVKWFGLTDSELIVNGQKQPEALHQKLKAAYGIRQSYGLYYGPVEMTGTGVFIDKDDEARNGSLDNGGEFKPDGPKAKFKQDKFGAGGQWFKTDGGTFKKEKFVLPRFGLGPVISDVIDDLVKAHVLNDRSDLVSFNLTNTFLIVNDIKQPEEIQKRLSAKYLKNLPDDGQPSNQPDPNFGLHYNAKTGSRGMGIVTDKNAP